MHKQTLFRHQKRIETFHKHSISSSKCKTEKHSHLQSRTTEHFAKLPTEGKDGGLQRKPLTTAEQLIQQLEKNTHH